MGRHLRRVKYFVLPIEEPREKTLKYLRMPLQAVNTMQRLEAVQLILRLGRIWAINQP